MLIFKRVKSGAAGKMLDSSFMSIRRHGIPDTKPVEARIFTNDLIIDITRAEYERLKEFFDGPTKKGE